ncbi:phage/plasmid primase, P4 family [Mycolicibacterium conceptionense]|uniref:DNA primase family protein n=1 Tax=Mycolicibacterium conceptionense TaxID=451644 RepID=UPI00336AFB33
MASGQVRIANLLADSYADKLLYVHSLGWHYWDGQRWALDDIGAAKRAVLDVLQQALAVSLTDKQLRADVRKCESATGIAGVLAIASALTEFAATVRDLDADPYLVNVANGTLDLRTMEMAHHNPADRLTKVARAAYRPDAEPGDWSRFLTAVLPDDDVLAYVQRQSGVALLGKVVEHVLPIWTGTGANGKSTAIGGLCWALGDYAMTAEPDLLLHREGAHPTGQMDLMGRRLAVITETDEGRKFAEATMKRLTGGDTIKARYMRQDFVEFEPSHTAILVTNHLPTVSGDDPAVWRRIRVVPFDVVIPEAERDPALPERLQACADEVLSWCIAGWAEYQKIGLAEPDAVLARTKDYRADSDVLGRFIADECVTVPTVKMLTSKLFEGFQHWRASEGVPEMSVRAFGQALDRHGYPAIKDRDGRYRQGIALRTTDL